MKSLGSWTSPKPKGNKYVLIYYEDTRIALAILPPPCSGAGKPAIEIKIKKDEDPKTRLVEELEKGGY